MSNIDESKMLEEIRSLLDLTIEEFVFQMDWPNSKYYDYIKNGRKRPGSDIKIKSKPTIDKVFTGINYAIENYPNWAENATKITAIVIKNLLPEAKK